MRFTAFFVFIAVIIFASQSGCRKDKLDQDSTAKLLFSKDTIVFDTVFTTVGSATRQFKVYNTSSKAVKITSIKLAGGTSSNFHINVDGVPVISTGDILLRGGDSMFVFVDVQVDPNNINSPLMIEDSVLFETNGNHQHVILNAVGQDAYFHFYSVLNCDEVWTNDKPHVIYGYAIVPSCCSLTLLPGTRVYLHHNAVLAADSCATLKVLGAFGNPVTFQGDRLEHLYSEEPGQWGYIWLSTQSRNNVIDWAEIKNGTIGILSDSSLYSSLKPTVRITNTKIRNMTIAGIFGRDSYMEGDNVSVVNCGQYCLAVAYGGRASFSHCTFANYWNISTRTTPVVLLNNWYKFDDVTNIERDLFQADFFNCIFYGDQTNELGLDSATTTGAAFNFKFSHCLLKTNVNTSNGSNFILNQYNLEPLFNDASNYNLHLNENSPARNIGDPFIGAFYPYDLDNASRFVNGNPDAGCYEGQ
jgi:hypothetical protein